MSTWKLVLVDGPERAALLPLAATRPVGDLRIGIGTLAEKWRRRLNADVYFGTEPLLNALPDYPAWTGPAVYWEAGLCPTDALAAAAADLRPGQTLVWQDRAVAVYADRAADDPRQLPEPTADRVVVSDDSAVRITRLWHLFQHNGPELERDFAVWTAGRTSAPVHPSNTVLGDRLFVEPGATLWASTLNSTTGPIYIGADAEVMEGCLVRGGLALGDHAVLKLGAKIYGPTTVGPDCRVGGEVNNSVLWGHSNKGHDGFLGNAVLGEWCNIGADSNNSNLKNNYEEVKLWSYPRGGFERTGLQFCGLVMGDHSKCGINTMFNTGTVVGVSCNVFGAGFPRNFIPDFSWGGAQGLSEYTFDKAMATADRVMDRRSLALTPAHRAILSEVHAKTADFRRGTTLA
jgi:UDP-N-acetylglucosamine diphosphorylase/glucosamine-1-phosphate N-acetyltransferase